MTYFPFYTVEKRVLQKVIWSELDKSLNGIIYDNESSETANYMYRLFTFVNRIRCRRMIEPIPTLGCLLYKRYQSAIEPVLILQALLFNTEIVHRISVNVIKHGRRSCSFGLKCSKGKLCFLMHSHEHDNFFLGEFVFCSECLQKLKVDAVLY